MSNQDQFYSRLQSALEWAEEKGVKNSELEGAAFGYFLGRGWEAGEYTAFKDAIEVYMTEHSKKMYVFVPSYEEIKTCKGLRMKQFTLQTPVWKGDYKSGDRYNAFVEIFHGETNISLGVVKKSSLFAIGSKNVEETLRFQAKLKICKEAVNRIKEERERNKLKKKDGRAKKIREAMERREMRERLQEERRQEIAFNRAKKADAKRIRVPLAVQTAQLKSLLEEGAVLEDKHGIYQGKITTLKVDGKNSGRYLEVNPFMQTWYEKKIEGLRLSNSKLIKNTLNANMSTLPDLSE